MKKLFLILATIIFANNAFANSESATSALHPKQIDWEFDGFLGRVDRASAQRGYKVYKDVCSACHSLKLFSYRNLQDLGFSEAEVKQVASEYMVTDGPNDQGEMFERPALPSDRFVGPYANDNAARAANGGALPPDLSLMIKARHEGANYVYSILTGFTNPPHGFEMAEGKNYNPYFEGRQIGMPSPLPDDGTVEYKDGTVATKEQMAMDIVSFLQFVAEPEMEQRKKMGIAVIIFLVSLTILFIIAKKRVWKRLD